MHDLNTINKLNADAFKRSIDRFRAQGRYVLARYEGLHLVSIETFAELTAAQLIAEGVEPNTGERAVIYAPFPQGSAAAALVQGRDQSEDYVKARDAEKTLGDYYTRKSQLLDTPEA